MNEKPKETRARVYLRRAVLAALDAAIVAFSFYFALLLRADGAVEAAWWPHNLAILYHNLPWIVAVYVASFLLGGLYSVLWKYAGERDLLRLAVIVAVPTGIVYVVNRRCIHGVLFNSANCMAAVLILLLVGGSRLAWRLFLNHPLGERLRGVASRDPNRPVMIVGAGEAGAWAINVCKTNKQYGRPVLAVDDDPAKLHQTIHGVPVKGTLEQIPELCKRYGIHTILVAIPTLKGSRLNHVIDLCVSTHCAVQMLSDPQLVGSGAPQQGAFRELNPADFLSRDEVTLDMEKISGYLTGKTVLVTGGGGSIGSELCRQVMRFRPGKLLIFDIYENNAYDIQQELLRKYAGSLDLRVEIGSVRDRARVENIFERYKPDIVFHAAAHKHVPLMEVSGGEAIKNNVFGTKNVADMAEKYDTAKFILISTDKAVNPTNIMGASKRLCEMIVQSRNDSRTSFAAVRFGNVLGSNGSVIPLFKRQIASGGPITITDKRIIRYFMTIPEASQLVMTAGAMAKSGELFVLDMGKPIRIYDLAVNMIKLSGLEPNLDIKIKEIGLRPGEKLYEELLMDEEGGVAVPAEGDVNVVYEDEDILIVDKSAPLACMSGAHHPDDALENRLAWRYRGENYVFRPVNRLDKGTSGLMAVARHAHAQQVLQNMLHTDAYVREYLALAVGRVEPERGTIDAPIGKADGATVRREVRADGKRAVTHYETVLRGENYTLLRVRLETGRTHQIRVHLQHIGHPIAGDFLYGEEDARLPGRFALHSARLRLTHPVTGERMAFESDAPRVFYEMLTQD